MKVYTLIIEGQLVPESAYADTREGAERIRQRTILDACNQAIIDGKDPAALRAWLEDKLSIVLCDLLPSIHKPKIILG